MLMTALVRNGTPFGIGSSGISRVEFWRTMVSAVSAPTIVGLQALFKENAAVAWFPGVQTEELQAELREREMNRGEDVTA